MTAETLVYARRKLSASLPVRPKIGSALMQRRNMNVSPMSVSFDSALSSLVKHSFLDKALVALKKTLGSFCIWELFCDPLLTNNYSNFPNHLGKLKNL